MHCFKVLWHILFGSLQCPVSYPVEPELLESSKSVGNSCYGDALVSLMPGCGHATDRANETHQQAEPAQVHMAFAMAGTLEWSVDDVLDANPAEKTGSQQVD